MPPHCSLTVATGPAPPPPLAAQALQRAAARALASAASAAPAIAWWQPRLWRARAAVEPEPEVAAPAAPPPARLRLVEKGCLSRKEAFLNWGSALSAQKEFYHRCAYRLIE